MTNKKHTKKGLFAKMLPVIAAVVLVALFLANCGSNSDSKTPTNTTQRPVITVGSADYPPFIDMDNNGSPTGIDMDIMREAADRIGYDIEFVSINWEDRNELLASGEIDCVGGGFTVNGREDEYLWVGPYMDADMVIVVNTDSLIFSLAELEGKTVAAQSAGIGEDILLEHLNPSIPTDVQVFSFERSSLMLAALGANYVDAVIVDVPVAIQYMKDYNTTFTILEEPALHASVGTAFAKDGDAELVAQLNAAIDEMRADGTLDAITDSYLSPETETAGGEADEN